MFKRTIIYSILHKIQIILEDSVKMTVFYVFLNYCVIITLFDLMLHPGGDVKFYFFLTLLCMI